jgi:serine/threonine protein kinase
MSYSPQYCCTVQALLALRAQVSCEMLLLILQLAGTLRALQSTACSSNTYNNTRFFHIVLVSQLAEGDPPLSKVHPMRAIFMIPSKPPPKLKETDKWTPEFIDFIAKALVKKPEDRATCQVSTITITALSTCNTSILSC